MTNEPFLGHAAFHAYTEPLIRPTKILRAKRIKQKRRAKKKSLGRGLGR